LKDKFIKILIKPMQKKGFDIMIQTYKYEWMFLLLHMVISSVSSGGNSRKVELVWCRCSSTDTAWHYPAQHLTEFLLGMISAPKERCFFLKLYLEIKQLNAKANLISIGAGW